MSSPPTLLVGYGTLYLLPEGANDSSVRDHESTRYLGRFLVAHSSIATCITIDCASTSQPTVNAQTRADTVDRH